MGETNGSWVGFTQSVNKPNIGIMNYTPLSHKKRSRSAGFSLLEVLISIIVLSFGLLGVVGMQAAALKANREAAYQASATRLGRELAEMMESNRGIAALTSTADNPYLATFTGAPSDVPTIFTTNCWTGDCYSTNTAATKTAIAKWQIQDWLYRVSSDLPGVRVAICFDETPYDADGLPQWTCNDAGTVVIIKIGWTRASTNSGATSGSGAFDRAVRPATVFPVTL